MDKTQIKQYVGHKVREYRLSLKLSQFALGEKVGINQRQVAQIECGKSMPSLNTLVKFAEVFDCEISEFFERYEEKSAEELRLEINKIINKFDVKQLEFLLAFVKRILVINI